MTWNGFIDVLTLHMFFAFTPVINVGFEKYIYIYLLSVEEIRSGLKFNYMFFLYFIEDV